MSSWMRSGLQTVVDGSRRLKEEILQNAGVYGTGCADPVLEARTQRFTQQSTSIDKLHLATAEYIKQIDAMTKASTSLVHEFKSFFNMQLAQAGKQECSEQDVLVKQLAQASECLEGIHWALKQTVHDATTSLLSEKVLKPLTRLKVQNAETIKNLQIRKQKMLDFDSLRRSVGSSRPSPEMQQKIRVAEESVAKVTADVNDAFDSLEDKRGGLMRNEFLAMTATQACSPVYQATKEFDSFQQLLPLMPGIASRLTDLSNFSRKKPDELIDPIENATLGVVDYVGSNCPINIPVNNLNLEEKSTLNVQRIDAISPFEKLHVAHQLVQETYYNAKNEATSQENLRSPSAFDTAGLEWMN